MDTDSKYKKDYKGIPFKTFVQRYGKREEGDFGIVGYTAPRRAHP